MEKLINTTDWMKVAEVELVYKSKIKASERPSIHTSKDAHALLMSIWDMNTIELTEHFKVLFLNQSGRVLGVYHLSSGGVTATVVDPKIVFSAALKACACSMVIAHNHPSGSLKISKADAELTSRLKEAGRLLDIKLLDHLIVTAESYCSFADEGLL